MVPLLFALCLQAPIDELRDAARAMHDATGLMSDGGRPLAIQRQHDAIETLTLLTARLELEESLRQLNESLRRTREILESHRLRGTVRPDGSPAFDDYPEEFRAELLRYLGTIGDRE